MLVSFTVKNFRSIRDELTLSLSAGRFKSASKSRAFDSGFSSSPCLLRAGAIYGANASGKSALMEAFDIFQDLVGQSAKDDEGRHIDRVVPYLGDDTSRNDGTEFEATFIENETLYTFGFALKERKIEYEYLHFKKKDGRIREMYSRSATEGGYDWHFSPAFKSKKAVSAWRESTRDNALFISIANQLNSEEVGEAYNWIVRRLRVVTSGIISDVVTSKQFFEDESLREEIVKFLSVADPSISDIEITAKPIDVNETFALFTEEFRKKIVEGLTEKNNYEVKIFHEHGSGSKFDLDFEQESDGTRTIYRYAVPFSQAIENDFVMVIDELDRSLHPLILEFLVSKISLPENLETKAQILFTTHDSNLLSSDVLARDQFWFMENSGQGGSKLIPLAEYKPRVNEAYQRAYLQGRYGGVPNPPRRMIIRDARQALPKAKVGIGEES